MLLSLSTHNLASTGAAETLSELRLHLRRSLLLLLCGAILSTLGLLVQACSRPEQRAC